MASLLAPQLAQAKPDFVDVVLKVYAPKEGSALLKATKACTACHADAPPKLNPFGLDLKVALKTANSKKLTAAILQTVESLDSDKDGASNRDELQGGTDPSVADSKPSSTSPSNPPEANKATAPALNAPADNPFAPETFIKPKHGNHPIVVHFPIALFMIGLLFDILGIKKKKPLLVQVGFYNLQVAAIASLPAILSGLLAWQWAYGGTPLAGYLLIHLILGIVTSVLLCALWRMRAKKREDVYQGINGTYIAIAVITLLVLTITGHLGGYLTFGS
jgi:uncharacterized membrane protein